MVDHHKLESCENIVSLCSMSSSQRNFLLRCCFSLWFCCTFSVGLFSLLIVSFLGGLYIYIYISSKHARSDPDRLGSIGQKRVGWFLLTGLLPDRIHLAKTWHRHPELTRIRAGFAQYDPSCLWTTANVSESGKLVAENFSCQKAGPMIPAQACFQTRCVSSNPDKPIQIGPGSDLYKMIHAFFKTKTKTKTELCLMREVRSGRYDPARFWLHAGRNGQNWA